MQIFFLIKIVPLRIHPRSTRIPNWPIVPKIAAISTPENPMLDTNTSIIMNRIYHPQSDTDKKIDPGYKYNANNLI